jgi:hypothetical protein
VKFPPADPVAPSGHASLYRKDAERFTRGEIVVGSGQITTKGWPVPSSPAADPESEPLNVPPHVATGHGNVVNVNVPCQLPPLGAAARAPVTGMVATPTTRVVPTAIARRQFVQSRIV